jgi:hypothetical protein
LSRNDETDQAFVGTPAGSLIEERFDAAQAVTDQNETAVTLPDEISKSSRGREC